MLDIAGSRACQSLYLDSVGCIGIQHVVSGILHVCSFQAKVLFDTSTTHSFVSLLP
jgi:hypothetical protein